MDKRYDYEVLIDEQRRDLVRYHDVMTRRFYLGLQIELPKVLMPLEI